MTRRPRREAGSALVVAILAVALAGAIAAALADLGRLALARDRVERAGVRAWFLAEGGLAETVAALAPGRAFDEALAAPPAGGGPGGVWTWAAALRDDDDGDPSADANERIVATVTARGPAPVRRRLEAMIGREPRPYLPAAAVLLGDVRNLTRDFRLDGRDFDVTSGCTIGGEAGARAGLAIPEDADLPAAEAAEAIAGGVRHLIGPDLTPLADDAAAELRAGGALAGALGDVAAPRFTVVAGDAWIESPATGAGLLYVTGRLSVRSALAFTGVVAAAAGVEVTAGAALDVCGALWAAGAPALDARGAGSIRASAGAIALAHRLAPLPARADVLAARELL